MEESRGGVGGLETAGSVAWFAMDGAWLFGFGFEVVAALMLLTTLAHVAVLALAERRLVSLAVAGALMCWVLFNVLWALDDMKELGGALLAAKAFCIAGAALLGAAWVASRYSDGGALRRFRRLRTGID